MEIIGPILIILSIIAFFFFTYQFEQKQYLNTAIIDLEKEIKDGISVKLSDGRIVEIKNITIEEKRVSNEYLFLSSDYFTFKTTYLDNLTFNTLRKLYVDEKNNIYEKNRLNDQKQTARKIEHEKLKDEQRKKSLIEEKKLNWSKLNYLIKSELEKGNIYSGVYIIFCAYTYNTYIGSTQNFDTRKSQHLSALKRNNHFSYLMQKDYNDFGVSGFDFYVLYQIQRSDYDDNNNDKRNFRKILEFEEQKYIDIFNPYYNYYKNIKEGKINH